MNMFLSSLKSSKIPLQGIFLAVIASLPLSPKAIANSSLPFFRERSPATEIQLQPSQTPATTINAQGAVAGRSLEIQEIRGSATLKGKPVAIGDRLWATGDEIITGDNSQVRLVLDNYLGVIEVSENTALQIETLSTAADGTPITAIAVSKGRVRLSIRRSAGKPDRPNALNQLGEIRVAGLNHLTEMGHITELAQQSNPSAKNAPVRVRTPRGVAGVRGTSFGISVGPDGKTAVDTIDGAVAVAGTQQEVVVNAGYWVVINGSEPTSAQLNPSLSELKVLSFIRLSANVFRLVGQVAPMDLVYINNQPIQTNAEGKFTLEGNLPVSRRLKVTVRDPSVRERMYELALP